jgi:hypothetical protein
MRCVPLLVAAGLLGVAVAGRAADQPISGGKLVAVLSGGDEKLVFVSRDPAFLFPTIGGADDPSVVGMQVDLISPVVPLGVSLVAPPLVAHIGWSATSGAVPTHRYRVDAVGAGALGAVVMKQGRMVRIVGQGAGFALAGPHGSVGIRVTTGSLRSCARFDAITMRRDESGRVVARRAAAAGLADCSNTALGGQEPPPPVCGDGVQNQSSEQCDGADLGECPMFLEECRPPGFAGECRCCGGPSVGLIGCCNPSSILLGLPDFNGICHHTRCDPPFTCSGGDVCQPDGSCCAPAGGACRFWWIPTSLGPCCDGLECGSFDGFGNRTCCVPDGGTCASDSECCTTHCSPGGTCEACRAGGVACGSPLECCSLACSGGTCDACAASGAACFDDAACCSLSCHDLFGQCE